MRQSVVTSREGFLAITSNSNLGIGGVYTGDWLGRGDHNWLLLSYYANQNSAASGIVVQQSFDKTTVHLTDAFTFTTGGEAMHRRVEIVLPFFRVVVTNGGTATTSLFLRGLMVAMDGASAYEDLMITGEVQGMAPTGAAIEGNPVIVGGNSGGSVAPIEIRAVASDAQVSPTYGLVGDNYLRAYNGTTWDRARTIGASVDSISPGTTGYLGVFNMPLELNGVGGYDRRRNNLEGTLLASAARAASTTSPDQTNYNGKPVYVRLNVTANPGGAETLALIVEWKDPITGDYIILANSGGQAFGGAAGDYVILLSPGAGAAANDVDTVSGYPLPRTWRVRLAHSAAGSWTYSVSYALGL